MAINFFVLERIKKNRIWNVVKMNQINIEKVKEILLNILEEK